MQLDAEGYLCRLSDWTPELAVQLAKSSGIELTEQHWQLVYLIRSFYAEFQLSPGMRPLVGYAREQLGPEVGRSIHFMQLFRGEESPAKVLARISGLPRPVNCD